MILPCPICGRTFERDSSMALPFCSPRCRQIDLGRWLGERYAVPVERAAEDVEWFEEPDTGSIPRAREEE